MVPVSRFVRARSWSLILLALFLSLPLNLLAPLSTLAQSVPGSQAVVITTDGDRLNVRSGAGRQFAAVGSLAPGTVVAVIDGPQTSADGIAWMKIQGGGLIGWASAEWLGDAAAAPVAPAAPAAPVTPVSPPWNPTPETVAPAPTPVAAPVAAPPTPAPVAPATPDTGSTINNGGGSPRVTGTGGRGARLRSQPSLTGAILLVIPEGAEVELVGAARTAEGYEWLPVRYTGVTGWVASSLLGANVAAPAATPVPTPAAAVPTPVAATPPPSPVATPMPTTAPPAPVSAPTVGALVAGDYAQVVNTDGYNLRIRAQPGLDTPIVSFAPPGAVLLVTAGPQADKTGAPWYGIDYAGVKGWVLAEHLARTNAPGGVATAPAPSATPPPPMPAPQMSAPPTATPAPSTGPVATPVAAGPAGDRGQAIIATAQRYLGVPYVYGGTTPAGWDCSGFIGYIYKTAVGISLPRSAAQQYRVGATIPVGQEQAGDIVFFSDTFGPGITHNGIALGGGRFIHARSEGYGTVISSLTDAYWSQHYVGARRP